MEVIFFFPLGVEGSKETWGLRPATLSEPAPLHKEGYFSPYCSPFLPPQWLACAHILPSSNSYNETLLSQPTVWSSFENVPTPAIVQLKSFRWREKNDWDLISTLTPHAPVTLDRIAWISSHVCHSLLSPPVCCFHFSFPVLSFPNLSCPIPFSCINFPFLSYLLPFFNHIPFLSFHIQ